MTSAGFTDLTAIGLFAFFAARSDCAQLVSRLLSALPISGQFVGNRLVLGKGTHASTLDGADVHEHILAAIIRLNEPVTLLIVEPLHFACSQNSVSLLV
jgi:hypothetical protein